MKSGMLNRQRIAPRVQVLDLRGRYTGTPLSKAELDRAVTALRNIGIDWTRLTDDSVRFALDLLLEDL